MKCIVAVFVALIASSASSAPAIDDDALQAALKKGTVKVVSFERHLGPPDVPDGSFARACRSWTLTETQVLSFFTRAEAISSDELRSAYSVLPCQYAGSLSIAGTRYQFAINIGRFGFIRGAKPENVSLFGCDEACKELFQMVVDGT